VQKQQKDIGFEASVANILIISSVYFTLQVHKVRWYVCTLYF